MKKSLLLSVVFLSILTTVSAQDTLIPYRVKDKWGYSDYSGKIKIAPQFDGAEFFITPRWNSTIKMANVIVKSKIGVIDKKGKYLVLPKYDAVEPAVDHGKFVNRFIVNTNGKFGVIDNKNKIVLPCSFDKILLKEKYSLPGDFDTYIGFDYAVQVGEEYFLIDSAKTKTEISYDDFQKIEYEDALSGLGPSELSEYQLAKILDNKTEILKNNKDKLDDLGTKWFIVGDDSQDQYAYIPAYKNKKVGLIDQNDFNGTGIDNIVVPIVNDEIVKVDRSFLMRKGNKVLWYSRTGKLGAIFTDEKVEVLEANYIVTKKNDKYGFVIISMPEKIIKPKYDYLKVTYYFDYLLEVTLNGKKGYVNINGLEYFKD